MVEEELTDGTRIGRLLASEVHGHERGGLGRLSVVEADPDVEPTEFGAFAYGVGFEREGGGSVRVADVYVHPDRLRVEFREAVDAAFEAAEYRGLRARPKAVDPPRALLFVENGAEVKDASGVLRTVAETLLEESG